MERLKEKLGSRPAKFIGGFLVIVGLGILVWQAAWYLSPEAREERVILDHFEEIEEQYRTDTYGGETPEETIELFIQALKDDDIELASKYFLPDKKTKLELDLEEIKSQGAISELIKRIGNIDNKYPLIEEAEDRFIFESKNQQGIVNLQVDVAKIPSGVWKIVDF